MIVVVILMSPSVAASKKFFRLDPAEISEVNDRYSIRLAPDASYNKLADLVNTRLTSYRLKYPDSQREWEFESIGRQLVLACIPLEIALELCELDTIVEVVELGDSCGTYT